MLGVVADGRLQSVSEELGRGFSSLFTYATTQIEYQKKTVIECGLEIDDIDLARSLILTFLL